MNSWTGAFTRVPAMHSVVHRSTRADQAGSNFLLHRLRAARPKTRYVLELRTGDDCIPLIYSGYLNIWTRAHTFGTSN